MIRRPPRSTLFPTRRSSDLETSMSISGCERLGSPAKSPIPFTAPHGGIRRESTSSRIALADRKSTRLNSSHLVISYAVFCLKNKPESLLDVVPRLLRVEVLL